MKNNRCITDIETKGLHGDFIYASIITDDNIVTQFSELTPYLKALESFDTILAHNASYEHRMLKSWGFPVATKKWLCTMVLAHCVFKNLSSYSLENLGETFNLKTKKVHLEAEQFLELSPELIERNVNDVLMTKELVVALFSQHLYRFRGFNEPKRKLFLQRLIDTWEQRTQMAITIAETSERGITFDAKFIESLHEECETYVRNETQLYFTPKFTKGEIVVLPEVSDLKKDKQLKKRCTARLEYFDYDGVIVSSTAHHAWERCPITPIRLSSATHASHSFLIKRDAPQFIADTGNIDTEVLVAKSLKGDGTLKTDIPNTVRDYFVGNKLAMVLGAKERYFKHLDENNRVHTRFNPVGTRTGRLSSSNPNLQNLGGSAKTGVTGLDQIIKQQRKFVVASPGHLLVGADYDSIEVVILAHILEIFGDVRMKEALATGVSPHDVNKEAWGCDRLTAKRGLFSIVYGATEWKLQTILDCSLNEAKQFLDKVNSGMPAISNAKAHYTRMCRELGGVFDLFGNFYDYPEVNASDVKLRSRAERQLFNAVIQGTCASLVSWVIPQVADVVRKYDGYLLSVIHDELITEVPTNAAEDAKDALNSLTQKRTDIPALLTSVVNADWVIGDSWASIH